MEYLYPVAKPDLRGNETKYLKQAIRKGEVSSQGSFVKEFEEKFAAFNEREFAATCSSGTMALLLALKAVGIKAGDEVIVPEFTMIATAWAVSYLGAKPVFVDCDDDFLLDMSKLEGKLTDKTKAIIPVHIYGRRINYPILWKIAHKHHLTVIDDSAESIGVMPDGHIACFSFYGNKVITGGEGGACVTSSPEYDEKIRYYRDMAFEPDHTFLHKRMGYNFRMTNLQAAVLLAQLERLPEFLKKRSLIEEIYEYELYGIDGIQIQRKRDVLWVYDILVENVEDRDLLMKFLSNMGIETRRFFKPMSMQPMYYDKGYKQLEAYQYSRRGLYLPAYTGLRPKDIAHICKAVEKFLKLPWKTKVIKTRSMSRTK